MASVAVIVLNYKTPELTIDCLRSLQIQVSDRAGRHVIVIDNASGDGSAEKIEAEIAKNSWDAWVRLIQSSVNGGFAAGNNLGIHSENADRYLLLNSDTIVRPGAIDKLMETMDQDSDIGLVVPRLIGTDGSRQVSCFRYKSPISEMLAAARTGPIDRVFSRYRVPLPNAEPSMNVDWASFACILIRKAVFEDIGHLDDGFFMYFEDIDYCRRARKAGWKIRICPEAQVVHLHGQSSSLEADKAARRRLPRYQFESRSRYFGKYYGGPFGVILANLFWMIGRAISWLRETAGNKTPHTNVGEMADNWVNWWNPKRRSSYSSPCKR